MSARHLHVGRLGEDAAAALLEAKGLCVLERNAVFGRLELDLVCQDQDTLVFVEVKTRAEGSLGTPADGLSPQKRARLLRAAQAYLSHHHRWHQPCRFDLVSVLVRHDTIQHIEHTENAMSADEPQGRRTSSWQPW